MKNIIYLVGFMGVGKTTVAKEYGQQVSGKWVDTDEQIEYLEGCSVQSLFAEKGEKYFRSLEAEVLKNIVKEASDEERICISCGGGIVLKAENVAYMKEHGIIIYLRGEVKTLTERLETAEGRPLLQVDNMTLQERVEQLMSQRKKLYEDAADVIVETDNKTPEEIVAEILDF